MTSDESQDDGHVDLSGLLVGGLSTREVRRVADHLDGCESCRDDLVELAAGHAVLAAAARTLGRDPARTPTPAEPADSPRRRWLPALAAAAAAVLVAGGVVVGLQLSPDPGIDNDADPTPSVPEPFASASLAPVTGTGRGQVTMTDGPPEHTEMTIEAVGLPGTGSDRFYYAWLLDPETDKMLPLGQVPPGSPVSFTVSDAVLLRYSHVDVSLERDDGDPAHSPTSVLRGAYADEAAPPA